MSEGTYRPEAAQAALADVEAVGGRVRRHTRGYGVFVLALAAFFPLVLLFCGFAPLSGAVLGAVSGVAGALVGIGSGLAATRIRAFPRRYGPRYLLAFLTSAALYAVVLILGGYLFEDVAAWWIGGAVATALPLTVLGVSVLRSGGARS
ncbi:hypothetical protein [Actinorugispora endophytica]|uniref:Uncharacterized protein n=1 Tax=Actinorugispora endophytica TaxID=1605990 RepID=A0A4R6UY22_9ACTN|nr:hypothetical protein [Actinorugispora endophytica]TDQ52374.1 hypothetical protein EV190_10611 [Actinorugispora endophytica]